jgi:hypothetical protein
LPNSATHIRFSDEEKSLSEDDADPGSNDLEGEKADITAAAAAIISDKSRRSVRLAAVPKVNYDDDASLSRHKVSSLKILRFLRGHLRRDSVMLIAKSTLDDARNGLFARKDIPSRSFMCDYTGTTYPSVEQVPESDRSNPYLWLLDDGQVIIGDPKQCYGAYINDPLDHHLVNCVFVWNTTRKVLEVWSNETDISKGSEILDKVLIARIKSLGTLHPQVATSYIHLSRVLFLQEEYENSFYNFIKGLELTRRWVSDEECISLLNREGARIAEKGKFSWKEIADPYLNVSNIASENLSDSELGMFLDDYINSLITAQDGGIRPNDSRSKSGSFLRMQLEVLDIGFNNPISRSVK